MQPATERKVMNRIMPVHFMLPSRTEAEKVNERKEVNRHDSINRIASV